MDLTPGGNLSLTARTVRLEFSWDSAVPLDVAALLLDASGRVRGDSDFVFFNQPSAEDGAVRLSAAARVATVEIELDRLPPDIDKVVLTSSIDTAAGPSSTFASVTTSVARIQDQPSGAEIATFSPPSLSSETALVVLEVYRRQNGWKVRAVGQGYADGLAGLARDFGVSVDETPSQEPDPSQPSERPKAPPEEAPKPSLVKLAKAGRVDISKTASIRADLRWDQKKDLDLYALYIDEQGEQGVVYYANKGQTDAAPYLTLSGDSKRGGQETVVIHRPAAFRFVLICAYSALSNGMGSFRSFGAHVVVDNGAGSVVEVPLYEKASTRYWTAIALIDLAAAETAEVRQIELYSRRLSEYRPVLHADGRVEMDAGPVEFKNATKVQRDRAAKLNQRQLRRQR